LLSLSCEGEGGESDLIFGVDEAEGEVEADLTPNEEVEEGEGLAGEFFSCLAKRVSREPFLAATGCRDGEGEEERTGTKVVRETSAGGLSDDMARDSP
jgi:hypothetical protein